MRIVGTAAVAGLAVAAALASACGAPQDLTVERPVVDRTRGVRYVVPPGWRAYDGEILSLKGSLLSIKIWDLAEADHTFVAELPDSLFPKLADWAKYYFIVDGPPTRTETSVAGLPATELTFPIRIRQKDPPSKVTYWVVRRESRLYVLRTAYSPTGLAVDEPAMRKVVEGWQFLEAPTASPS